MCKAVTLTFTILALATDLPTSTTPPNDGVPCEVRFLDGSTVKLRVMTEHVVLVTRYGKLTVPLKEVRKIDLGLRFPDGVARKIDQAVVRLGANDFKLREAAGAELIALGEYSFPAVRRAVQSGDAETVKRAQSILKTLKDRLPEERLRVKPYDTVHTADFPAIGRIEPDVLEARSAYFGRVQLSLADVRSFQTLVVPGEVEVLLDSAKYGVPDEVWLDTGIEITTGADLAVRASGEIDLYPIAPEANMYLVSPAGSSQWSRGGPFPNGALLGRIGEKGKVFVIGEKYEGASSEEGRLFLRIVASPWRNVPSGTFTVRIAAAGTGR